MSGIWLMLPDIPAEGRDFLFDDPVIWAGPAEELGLAFEVLQPLRAEVRVECQSDGYLVTGTLMGRISLPCDRCAEPALVELSEQFQEFEPPPKDEQGSEEADAESRIFMGDHGLVLDISSILWEQLMLALPVKPLCREDCKGLCPGGGQNLNEAQCGCVHEELDPRLAPLRKLKFS